MKSKYVLLASALLISVSNFAQKDQIKAAEKAMKNGNSAEAIATLNQAESTIASATDAEKSAILFCKRKCPQGHGHQKKWMPPKTFLPQQKHIRKL